MPWSGGAEEIPRTEIPQAFDETIWQRLRVWAEWKRKGWPMTGGWYDAQPAWIVDIIDAVEAEASFKEGKAMEKMQDTQRSAALGMLNGR